MAAGAGSLPPLVAHLVGMVELDTGQIGVFVPSGSEPSPWPMMRWQALQSLVIAAPSVESFCPSWRPKQPSHERWPALSRCDRKFVRISGKKPATTVRSGQGIVHSSASSCSSLDTFESLRRRLKSSHPVTTVNAARVARRGPQ